jgi:hypothetical protein
VGAGHVQPLAGGYGANSDASSARTSPSCDLARLVTSVVAAIGLAHQLAVVPWVNGTRTFAVGDVFASIAPAYRYGAEHQEL